MSDRGPFPTELTSLLDAERAHSGPPAGARDRVGARVEASLGLALGLGAGVAASSSPALAATGGKALAATGGKALSAALGWKLAACALVATAGGVGVYAGARHHAAKQQAAAATQRRDGASQHRVSAPVVTPLPAPTATRQPEAALQQSHAASQQLHAVSQHARPTVHRAADPISDLAAERTLLDAARTALATGDATQALTLVAQHGHRFPRGQLAEERESLWIRALVATGDATAAHARGDRFRSRWPHSLLLPAVDATLKSVP